MKKYKLIDFNTLENSKYKSPLESFYEWCLQQEYHLSGLFYDGIPSIKRIDITSVYLSKQDQEQLEKAIYNNIKKYYKLNEQKIEYEVKTVMLQFGPNSKNHNDIGYVYIEQPLLRNTYE